MVNSIFFSAYREDRMILMTRIVSFSNSMVYQSSIETNDKIKLTDSYYAIDFSSMFHSNAQGDGIKRKKHRSVVTDCIDFCNEEKHFSLFKRMSFDGGVTGSMLPL